MQYVLAGFIGRPPPRLTCYIYLSPIYHLLAARRDIASGSTWRGRCNHRIDTQEVATMITKFRTAGSLGLVLGAALVLGCATYPVNVEKTTPEDPIIMKGKQLKVVPNRTRCRGCAPQQEMPITITRTSRGAMAVSPTRV